MIDNQPLLDVEHKEYDEDKALGGKPPLATLFSLLAGPLLSQVTNAMYGIVNTIWIEKGIGDEGLKVLAVLYIYDALLYSLGNLLTISGSSHISYLFGKNQPNLCNQLIADLIRVAFILGIVYPAISIPTTIPVVKWLSKSDQIAHEALRYIEISAGCSFVPLLYYVLCGVLQGEGRTWLFGFIQIVTLMLDMLLFLPLFVLYFKWGVWAAALSQILSQFIITFILFICLLARKFSLDFKLSYLCKKFSKESSEALQVGFASFILNLSEAFPQFALQKFVILVADHVHLKEPALTCWNIFGRLYMVACCILVAFDAAYLPPTSYAYAKRQYKRVLRLTVHTLWISLVWGGVACVVVVLFPREIIKLFSKDIQVQDLAADIMWLGFITLPLYPIHSIAISMLQAIKLSKRSTVLSIMTTLLPMPIFSVAFYYTHPNSMHWIFGTYVAADVSAALFTFIIMLYPFIKLIRLNDGEKFSDDENKEQPVISQSIESIADLENKNQ